jgi:hypothetical protein
VAECEWWAVLGSNQWPLPCEGAFGMREVIVSPLPRTTLALPGGAAPGPGWARLLPVIADLEKSLSHRFWKPSRNWSRGPFGCHERAG